MEKLNMRKHGKAIPSFLRKTYQMLEDQENKKIIKWNPSGVGFIVASQSQFSKTLLPKYFKHSKYSSFVRQLNMYNFHKVRSTSDQNCFIHEKFVRHDIKGLESIKRKPERKKKTMENDSLNGEQDESHSHDPLAQNLQPSVIFNRTSLADKYHQRKFTSRGNHRSRHNDDVVFSEIEENCFRITTSYSNLVKETPATGIELQDYDNISIENQIENRSGQLKIPTRLLIHNEGSGIFPINTGMISIYSMSNLIK